jgi:gamma-glutamyltranspeptidase/glutathione hydrolase
VLVHREGRLVAVTGTMGGGAQPQIDAMSLIRAFDLEMDAQDAVSAPRWLVGGMDIRNDERMLIAEASLPDPTRDALRHAGYRVETVGQLDDVGHAHLIRVLEDGTFEAGSDPRADGGASAR